MRIHPRAAAFGVGLVAAAVPLTPAVSAPAAMTDAQAVQRYAPVVYLHPQEPYKPISAATFIKASTLRWHHDDGCGDDELARSVDPAKLATGGYSHQTKQHPLKGCDHEGRAYASNENVRPKGNGASGGEGMFLDLPDSLHGGHEKTRTPIYYDVRKTANGKAINYWFSYGYSYSRFKERPDGGHDGDWEHITVLLGAGNRAHTVFYAQHDGGCVVPLDYRNRPTVYSARESHASYPQPGDYETTIPEYFDATLQDEARGGEVWDARGKLRPLNREPWYGSKPGQGYGGGWGEVGNFSATTGPLGPHRDHKTGLPGPGTGPCREPVRRP